MKKEIWMVELDHKFQNKIFTEIIKRYSSKKCVDIFNKSRAMFYHYKNNRVKNIPLDLVKQVTNLLDIPQEILNNNIKRKFILEEQNNMILEKGRKIRRNQLNQLKRDIPELNTIREKNHLNLEKWFNKYKKLINFGARKILQIKTRNNKLLLKYTNYAKSVKREFNCILPRKIKIDLDFIYFLGLWIGDRVGGGRLGVMNKQEEINQFTEYYLRKLYQNPKRVLYAHTREIPKLKKPVNKIVYISSSHKGYAISVHTINGILKSFFHYIEKDIDLILNNKNQGVFLAGLFDAEGNINLRDRVIRISQKNPTNVKLIQKLLKNMNFGFRYDGHNFVIANTELTRKRDFQLFSETILPYIKHSKKKKEIYALLEGKGYSDKELRLVKIIKNNPGITNRGITEIINRKKNQAYLRALTEDGLITREGKKGESFKYYPLANSTNKIR